MAFSIPEISLPESLSLTGATALRAGFARSFSRVTVVASSSHYSGFIGQCNFASMLYW